MTERGLRTFLGTYRRALDSGTGDRITGVIGSDPGDLVNGRRSGVCELVRGVLGGALRIRGFRVIRVEHVHSNMIKLILLASQRCDLGGVVLELRFEVRAEGQFDGCDFRHEYAVKVALSLAELFEVPRYRLQVRSHQR